MKKLIFVLVAFLVGMTTAGAQTTKVSEKVSVNEGVYTSVSTRGSSSSNDVETPYQWCSPKGEHYKLYLHLYQRGEKAGQWTVYVIRKSQKTGKDYKYYVPDGEAIAADIIKNNPSIIKGK